MKNYYGDDFSALGTIFGVITGGKLSLIFSDKMYSLFSSTHSELMILSHVLPVISLTVFSSGQLFNYIGLRMGIY